MCSNLFYLELTLGFYRGPLKYLKRFVLSPYKKGHVKLFRLIWYVKLHGKYCPLGSNAKLSDMLYLYKHINVPEIVYNS